MLLFLDTESDPVTKRPLSLQWATETESGVITTFDEASYQFMARMWFNADAVVFYNAPYDLGVISIMWPRHNSYRWVDNKSGQYWLMQLFGHSYRIFRISGFRNSIRAMGLKSDVNGTPYREKDRKPKSTPVIDLLKLWSILVDDGEKHSISLKSLIERELHQTPIPYSPTNAMTRDYQLQDVERLRELWSVFLARVSTIEAVASYSYAQWANVKTPATFTKIAYEEAYPSLKLYQESNDLQDDANGLRKALENAYHGGITVALKRGVSERTAWYDIHGAYAHIIEYENTDRYLTYTWDRIDPEDLVLHRGNDPVLCKVTTDACITSIGKSLKIYRLKKPTACYLWGYDILALNLLFPDANIVITAAYRLIPGLPDAVSLPSKWAALKEEEERLHGKTTRREFYKLLSNTSYGIKAQRKPYRTKHTNMAIAGVITARAHLILAEMIDEAQRAGCRWIYSDTDSICIEHDNQDMAAIEDAINRRIAPYSAGCEGYGMLTKTLSLKRYTSKGGQNIDGTTPRPKIRLHGKGQYRVRASDLSAWVDGNLPDNKPLPLASVAANTERTMNRVIKLNPQSEPNKHPFMFETDVKSDVGKSDWFNEWYAHIDTKTDYVEGADVNATFYREFRTFETQYHAISFYGSKIVEESGESGTDRVDWDMEDEMAFDA